MSPSTTKKVFIRRFEREPVHGFASPQHYLQPTGIEILKPEGSILLLAYREVKCVAFVREFPALAASEDRKVFHTRPKMEGLWVRLLFRDGDLMEGILPNNLLLIDPYGFSFVPPDPFSNNQRIFVPREALRDIHVLGVVGGKAGQDEEGSRRQGPNQAIRVAFSGAPILRFRIRSPAPSRSPYLRSSWM